MRTLVVGATGIVGGHIVEQLLKAGERPFALSRTPPMDDPREVTWITGDLGKPETLALADISTIFCTANAGSFANALAAIHSPSLKRVVAFTSTSIVTKADSELATEREWVEGWRNDEARLAATCERLGIAWTILRPTIIYAEGRDQNVTRLAGLIRKFGFLPLAGRGAGLRQPVHAQDLAIGAVNAAASNAAVNRIYALPGGEIITYREMVGRIFDALNRPRRIISMPPGLWRLAFALLKPFFPAANSAMGSRMAKDMIFDSSEAEHDFGWRPRPFRPEFK